MSLLTNESDGPKDGNNPVGSNNNVGGNNEPAQLKIRKDDAGSNIEGIPFVPPEVPKGALKDFISSCAGDLGVAPAHAWAIWHFAINAHLSRRVLYDLGGVERRLGLNVVLAGDDHGKNVRRLAIEALSQSQDAEVITNLTSMQLIKNLKAFRQDHSRVIIDTTDEDYFQKWHKKVSKQEISLAQLFENGAFNDYLMEDLRSPSMPPVSVPVLLACGLMNIFEDRDFPNIVFRDAMVIPSFSCEVQRSVPPKKFNQAVDRLCSMFPKLPDDEMHLQFSTKALEPVEALLGKIVAEPLVLADEGSDFHQRRIGMVQQIIGLSVSFSIALMSGKGEVVFSGKINKPEVDLAVQTIEALDAHWVGLKKAFEQASRVDEVHSIYIRILAEFAQLRDDKFGGVRVPFSELAKMFCHHPSRDGQYSARHFELEILADLQERDLARRLSGPDKRVWVFYGKA